MKKTYYKDILISLSLLLFNVSLLVAAPRAPRLLKRGGGGFEDGVVDGTSLDNHLIVLFFIAILLGGYFFSKYSKKEVV